MQHGHGRGEGEAGALREQGKRKNKRGQENVQQTQAVQPHMQLGADRGNPGMTRNQVQSRYGRIEGAPELDREEGGDRAAPQRHVTRTRALPDGPLLTTSRRNTVSMCSFV